MSTFRTRLAPTPSGFLHTGNAISFVVSWALARTQGGWILLRIDDLDAGRCRPEYIENVFQTLDWLGLDYDEGPSGPEDLRLHYSQQLRIPLYQKAIQQLKDKGYLYACTCTRKQIQAVNVDRKYPGTCRKLGNDFDTPETAWRLKVPKLKEVCFQEWKKGQKCTVLSEDMGDFVIKQKNGAPAYQIASLVDDEYWKINFIVRGGDLRDSSAAQMYLANILEYTAFQEATFWHHDLINRADGQKLSKSHGDDPLKTWREQEKSPEPIFKMAAQWLQVDEREVFDGASLVSAMKG